MAIADFSRTLQGQVALVTGANSGIGRVTARVLASRGAQVFIACRSPARSQAALDDIGSAIAASHSQGSVELLELDLADLASVRRCAQAFLARELPLHLLINNAGLAGAKGMTASGFEIAFGTNHVGHFLLTQLLLQRLQRSAPARVVTVSSVGHYQAKGIPWEALRRPTVSKTGLPEYCVSKLANVLFTAELARRTAGSGVTTYAVHPGAVATDVWRELPAPLRWLITRFMLSNEQGAATSVYCATSPQVAQDSGLYYDKLRPKTPSQWARDPALAAELWRRSEEWIRQ